MNGKNFFSRVTWDRLGIGLSGLCAIHCLFFPVVIALLPMWPVAESLHQWTHPILFLLVAPTVYFALRHKQSDHRIPWFLYVGLVVIAAAWLLHDWVGSWGESIITLIGSALLIGGHWLNFKAHRKRYHETA